LRASGEKKGVYPFQLSKNFVKGPEKAKTRCTVKGAKSCVGGSLTGGRANRQPHILGEWPENSKKEKSDPCNGRDYLLK